MSDAAFMLMVTGIFLVAVIVWERGPGRSPPEQPAEPEDRQRSPVHPTGPSPRQDGERAVIGVPGLASSQQAHAEFVMPLEVELRDGEYRCRLEARPGVRFGVRASISGSGSVPRQGEVLLETRGRAAANHLISMLADLMKVSEPRAGGPGADGPLKASGHLIAEGQRRQEGGKLSGSGGSWTTLLLELPSSLGTSQVHLDLCPEEGLGRLREVEGQDRRILMRAFSEGLRDGAPPALRPASSSSRSPASPAPARSRRQPLPGVRLLSFAPDSSCMLLSRPGPEDTCDLIRVPCDRPASPVLVRREISELMEARSLDLQGSRLLLAEALPSGPATGDKRGPLRLVLHQGGQDVLLEGPWDPKLVTLDEPFLSPDRGFLALREMRRSSGSRHHQALLLVDLGTGATRAVERPDHPLTFLGWSQTEGDARARIRVDESDGTSCRYLEVQASSGVEAPVPPPVHQLDGEISPDGARRAQVEGFNRLTIEELHSKSRTGLDLDVSPAELETAFRGPQASLRWVSPYRMLIPGEPDFLLDVTTMGRIPLGSQPGDRVAGLSPDLAWVVLRAGDQLWIEPVDEERRG